METSSGATSSAGSGPVAQAFDPTIQADKLFRVEGLVALVTGGGTGIGFMIAKALAHNGAHRVFITGRRLHVLQEAAKKIDRAGHVVPLYCDVTSKVSLESLVSIIGEDVGYLNVVFCNAGAPGPFVPAPDATKMSVEEWAGLNLEHSIEKFTEIMTINVSSVWYTAMTCLPLLNKGNKAGNVSQTSQVIATSSTAALNKSIPGGSAYGISKAALVHLIKQLSAALPQWGIRANCIAPGFFPSDMTDPIVEKAGGIQGLVHAIPLGRMGNEQDMAGLALYLASRAGAYCNGNVITTDGGQLSCLPSTF